jgi:peptidyl-prolyl cis-trans isomerase A (cyclophilin A)
MLMRWLLYFFLLFIILSCHRAAFSPKWISQRAPEHFSAVFETSKGSFTIEATREWSPMAVDRFYSQIKHGYYNHIVFYRVRPGYVAQFGADDTARIKQWGNYKIPDEPVRKANERGTVSFATDGKETRGSDIFINLRNNSPRLDTIVSNGVKGYPGIAVVTTHMEVIDSLYSGYGDGVFSKYDTLLHNKKAFLEFYPKLDSIKRVFLVTKPPK